MLNTVLRITFGQQVNYLFPSADINKYLTKLISYNVK